MFGSFFPFTNTRKCCSAKQRPSHEPLARLCNTDRQPQRYIGTWVVLLQGKEVILEGKHKACEKAQMETAHLGGGSGDEPTLFFLRIVFFPSGSRCFEASEVS